MGNQIDMARRKARTGTRREQGAALIIAVMMLLLLGLMGLASLDTVMRDRQVSGFQSRARAALYAAEAGVASALSTLRTAALPAGVSALAGVAPTVSQTNLGDSTIYPNGQPWFRAEPGATPISYLGSGGPCAEWEVSLEVGGPIWLYSLWDIRVEGGTTDGARATVQGSASRCYAYDG